MTTAGVVMISYFMITSGLVSLVTLTEMSSSLATALMSSMVLVHFAQPLPRTLICFILIFLLIAAGTSTPPVVG